MDVRQLKHFHAIVEFGGFGRAAGALNISQSALTQSIANLERELGVSLLDRSQAGAKMTAAGALLRNRSELVLREMERATLELRELAGAPPEMRIGIDKNLSANFMASVMTAFLASRRQVMVEVREQWADQLAPALEKGELDLIVSCLPPYVDDHNIHFERLFDKSTRPLVGRQHPVLRKPSIDPEDLSNSLWGIRGVGPAGDGKARVAFAAAGVAAPSRVIYTDSTDLILSMVRQSEMIGFLSVDLVQPELRDGSIVALSLKGLYLREPVYLAHHARSPLTPAVLQLKAEILEAAHRLMLE